MKTAKWRRWRIVAIMLMGLLASASSAGAGGLGLPIGAGGVGPLELPQGNLLPRTVDRTATGLTSTLDSTLGIVRDAVGRPRREGAFDRDLNGARVLRRTVLALSPGDRSLVIARGLGFAVARENRIGSLGITIVRLRAPDGVDSTDALAQLRKADPEGTYDYDHIYNPSGDKTAASSAAVPANRTPIQRSNVRLGMIDAGIDRKHRDFDGARIVEKNIVNDNDSVPTAHGTAVASLLVGTGIEGSLPEATLYAADVFGGDASGGAADDIARALGWLAGNNVTVANISLAGPRNVILKAAVDGFLKGGRVIVAAVGNDGPAAPTEYPAGYDGVVAVTSVDGAGRVQLDANQGACVAFAALGVDRRVARLGGGHTEVTGTSFAAPQVTIRFAVLIPQASEDTVRTAWLTLEHDAHDLGDPGRDPVFGYGLLAPFGARLTQ